ncbi:GNAT family N-acetyltransferase [Paramicrobacterium humi]|uniref:GNAT family N-acetyltransferase n=1 Tax=Paramicrobacterium humi TaxID=640635 RepID=UPI001C409873|nr:GNAT family N-acetyltransferase [Microbacterium humi]
MLDEMVRELAAHEGSAEHVRVDEKGWRASLKRDDVTVLIAEQRQNAVGFASMMRRFHLWSGAEHLALDDLFVREGHRDQGIGTQLMSAVAELADEDDLLVLRGVRLDNYSGQRFYSRLGASLTTKMTATWTREHYRLHLAATR